MSKQECFFPSMPIESLDDIFFRNYKQFLSNCAVIYNDGKEVQISTYEQLATECFKVSKCLQNACAEGFIGIHMDKKLALPAVILGILHSNLPFICIDVQESAQNILHSLEYLNVKWVFTSGTPQAKDIFSKYGPKSKYIDLYKETCILWNVNVNFNSKLLPVSNTPKLAYAIQTSGSTGKPKIVRVPHQCILPNVLDLCDILQVHHSDVIFWGSPLTFDPSIIELFLPFAYGAVLLVVPSSVRISPLALLEVLFPCHKEIYAGTSILQVTPSTFSRWSIHDIQSRVLSKNTTLKKLLLGGEPCPNIRVLRNWKGLGNKTEIFNIYGVTEVSCWAAVECVNFSCGLSYISQTDVEEKCMLDIPLGSPLSKTVLQVRNDFGCTISCGEGELFIGSSERVCLVNEEVFNELSPPVFRATGDIVKLDEHCKHIKFIGRKNRTIKRWGHQVCLNKVEMILSEHSNVRGCCCVWIQSKSTLVVAVVWKENEDCQRLRLFSLYHLHRTEVPDAIVSVNSFPLTNHGKIDYEKLQLIILNESLQNMADNDKTSLLKIQQVWKNILGREPSLNENFISSGGNSLLAVQLTSEIEKVFGESIRSVIMSMLLANSSFLEVQNYLLTHKHGKCSIDSQVDSENAFRIGNCIQSTNLEEETSEKVEKGSDTAGRSSVVENMYSVSSSNKRKFTFHSSQIVKQNKMETLLGSVSSSDNHSLQSGKFEDELIKVCCRGKVVKKKSWSDEWSFNPEDKIALRLNWKFDMHKCVDASPCYLQFVKSSLVVVGSHSHLLVVMDSFSGEVVSKCELPDRIESSVCPSVCGRCGIVGCYDGRVYCISFNSGEIVWSFHTGDIVKSSPSLCLGNTAVIVGSYDSSLYCINVKDGNMIWKNSPSSASIYAKPCISNNTMVYIGTLDGTCVGLCEKTGQLVWKTKLSSPVFSSPILMHSDMAVVFAEVVGIVHCYSASSGDKLWEFKASGNIFSSFSSVSISDHFYELLVFGSHDKNVYCLKWNVGHDNVTLFWKQELESAVFATPFIYATDNNSSKEKNYSVVSIKSTCITAAVTKGLLYILNAEDGSVKCFSTLANEIFSSPIICEGKVLVGCRDNHVYSFSLVKQ